MNDLIFYWYIFSFCCGFVFIVVLPLLPKPHFENFMASITCKESRPSKNKREKQRNTEDFLMGIYFLMIPVVIVCMFIAFTYEEPNVEQPGDQNIQSTTLIED